ncbi:flagellar basal body rod protein FlgF [Oceaniserpentilla sp. 4NH20-0058]|uniref:flagellar basal body rod protein FlgF n=1 Tax=Oceaniserpentilla sp. 4NH20-0058 TaxID=3127660 RepID=UPI0031043F2A
MDRALYIAMSGAKQNTIGQAAEANNLANVSTTGFRRDFEQARSMPVFGDYYPTRAYAMEERPASDFNPGTLIHTGRDLDIGIDNQGWIAVQDSNGEEAYTRRGDLRVDQLGRLINGEGLQVMGVGGPLVVPPYEKLEIAGDGTISIQALGDDPAVVADIEQLKLVMPDLTEMEKGEDGLFRMRGQEPGDVQPFDPTVRVESGHLEHSNVNAVQSLTQIMSLHRQYELQVKMMSTADENAQVTQSIMDIQ